MTDFLKKSFSVRMPGKKAADWPWPEPGEAADEEPEEKDEDKESE